MVDCGSSLGEACAGRFAIATVGGVVYSSEREGRNGVGGFDCDGVGPSNVKDEACGQEVLYNSEDVYCNSDNDRKHDTRRPRSCMRGADSSIENGGDPPQIAYSSSFHEPPAAPNGFRLQFR